MYLCGDPFPPPPPWLHHSSLCYYYYLLYMLRACVRTFARQKKRRKKEAVSSGQRAVQCSIQEVGRVGEEGCWVHVVCVVLFETWMWVFEIHALSLSLSLSLSFFFFSFSKTHQIRSVFRMVVAAMGSEIETPEKSSSSKVSKDVIYGISHNPPTYSLLQPKKKKKKKKRMLSHFPPSFIQLRCRNNDAV
uniref:Uncharacterized protein n=1 Tax=Podospora anserina (strain S / ATCC MYA-4624 / DSM 980 / FGSC 10383) TaxID=515849 RepID=A0A090CGX8_PODAN|nr:Putative protein of unknown function [Podospora anserina S mat+]